MADKRDYYEVLGVDKNISDDDLKKAYRKKAKLYHPDLHPGDAEAEKNFKEVSARFRSPRFPRFLRRFPMTLTPR